MTCKGICTTIYKPTGNWWTRSRYSKNTRRCSVCGVFIQWAGLWCPCCGYRVRVKKRGKKLTNETSCSKCDTRRSYWGKNMFFWFIFKGQKLCTHCVDDQFNPKCDLCKGTKSRIRNGRKHWYRFTNLVILCDNCYHTVKYGLNSPLGKIKPTNTFYQKLAETILHV